MTSMIDRILAHEPEAIAWTRQASPDFVGYAEDAFGVMSQAVKGYTGPATLFRGAWVHARKMAGLAVLSGLRQHRVESAQNLRQLIEMISLFGYVAENPDIEGGWGKANATAKEIRVSNEEYRIKSFKWLEATYPDISSGLKFFKNHINSNHSHGTILSSGYIYDYQDTQLSDQRFFDVEDVEEVRLGMMMTGRVISMSLALLVRVSSTAPIIVRDDLIESVIALERRVKILQSVLAKTYGQPEVKGG